VKSSSCSFNRLLLSAVGALGVAAGALAPASADVLPIDFESYATGDLISANGGYPSAADGRLPGQTDGANKWWNPTNSATVGEVATRAARTGTKGLVLLRRDTTGGLDGVINGALSPRLAQLGGETSAPVNATNSRFRFSYWFRTGPTTPITDFWCGAESWGPITAPTPGYDRYTWHRFGEDGAGNLTLYSVGMVNNASLGYFPALDTIVATNLTWGAWYRVEVTVSFVNGGDDNDQVITRIYDSSNTLVGTGYDTTWETGFRYALFYPTQVFGVDSVAFQARSYGGPFRSFAGDVAYIDDMQIESLPPVDTKLNVAQSCTNSSTINVTIDLTNTNQAVAGGQFFLQYDNTKLQYVGGTPGALFPLEVIDTQPAANQIDYAVGIMPGNPSVSTPATFATLTFTKLADVCASDALTLVNFRPRAFPLPPTRLTDEFGAQVGTTTTDLAPFTMDMTAPIVVTPAPAVTVNSTPGLCTGVPASVPAPVFSDNCGPLTITAVRSDNPLLTLSDPFPAGVTTITWTATDCAGNPTTTTQTVTVSGTTPFNVTVQLAGTFSGMFDRCIRFEFYDIANCPTNTTSVDAVVSFVNGLGTASIPVPCGNYSCVTARDPRHTLRRTITGIISGPSFAASFTGAKALLSGNLNDDIYVDILDFGGFAGQFGVNYGTASTTCATPYPHADLSGNALVDIADFSFIQSNFLTITDANCCGNLLRPAPPVTDIAVSDLVASGKWTEARGDLNRDGRLNTLDVARMLETGMQACIADYTVDQRVSVEDIFGFLNGWFAGHPAADVDGSQQLEVQDIFTFLGHWFQGC
jgi:Cohesin domain